MYFLIHNKNGEIGEVFGNREMIKTFFPFFELFVEKQKK